MDLDRLEQLLLPISDACPEGEDMAYSALFDEIREARRADDPALAQGDWETAPKRAEWARVRQLCEETLCRRSKDLQIAAWYAEALTRIEGFDGLTFGLRLVTGLLRRYWDSGYPSLDGDGADERAAKLDWLSAQLADEIRRIPLTASVHDGYDWYRYRESREVDNLALRDAGARERCAAEGKLAGEQFDRSAELSGRAWFEALGEQLSRAQAQVTELRQEVDARFTAAAPHLAPIEDALGACGEICRRSLERFDPVSTDPATTTTQPLPHREPGSNRPAVDTAVSGSTGSSRADAIGLLHEAVRYFRTHEPHSPVALLVERAAGWAEMSLEDWLATVIKDGSTLSQIDELLGIRRG
ncbi:type VI secretion system protein TssA [Aromatoleum sp.]|uniref:type VI secretion system protein TssA n=1 Tax=Aromatoleum sp. TaxID=2307007 RepID=UPI002FC6E90A